MNYFNLDIVDLNPVDNISYIKEIIQKDSTKTVFSKHIKQIFKSFTKRAPSKKVDILFYGTTINNQRTFNPIIANTKYSYYNIRSNEDFEISQYMLWSFLFIVPWFFNFFRGPFDKREKFKSNKIKYLLTYGKYIVAGKVLRKYRPKVLVMANDHGNMNRCFLRNAASLGIKTIYIQHASVSNQFPLLEFDYSFLDGLVSFDAYRKTSKQNSLVFLSGPCRFDYMGQYTRKTPLYIGLSINEFDDFEIVSNICRKLKDNGINYIKVRPHPSMGLWHKEWFDNNNIIFSTPAIESPGEYLSSLKLQVSNVSGIHLDAVMLKIPSVLYQFSKHEMQDIFCFKEHNIISYAKTYDELQSIILSCDNNIVSDSDVQYFVASYNTAIEFKVGQNISHYIDLIMECDFDHNKIIESVPKELTVYKF